MSVSEGVFGEQLDQHPPLLLDEHDDLATPDVPLTQDEGEHLDEEANKRRSCAWWLLLGVLGGVAVAAVSTVIVLVRDVVLAPSTQAWNPEFLAPSTPAGGVVSGAAPGDDHRGRGGAAPGAAPLSNGGSVAPEIVAPASPSVVANAQAPEGAVKGPMSVVATEHVKGETEFDYAGKRYVEKLLTDDMVKLIKEDVRWSESLRNIAQRPSPTKGTEAKKNKEWNKMGPLLLTNGVVAVLKDQKWCKTREALLAYSMATGLVVAIRGDH